MQRQFTYQGTPSPSPSPIHYHSIYLDSLPPSLPNYHIATMTDPRIMMSRVRTARKGERAHAITDPISFEAALITCNHGSNRHTGTPCSAACSAACHDNMGVGYPSTARMGSSMVYRGSAQGRVWHEGMVRGYLLRESVQE